MNLYIIESKGSAIYRLPSGDNQLQGLALKHGGVARFEIIIAPEEGLPPITSLRFGIRRASGKNRIAVLIAQGRIKASNTYEMDVHLNSPILDEDFAAALAQGKTVLQYEAEFEWMRADADGSACRSSSSIIGLSLTHSIIQTGTPNTPELAQYPAPSEIIQRQALAAPNGVATLGADGKLTATQLPTGTGADAINTHNTQAGAHANLRNEYINNLVPSAGMTNQVLMRHGATAGQYRWQTAPWVTAAYVNDYFWPRNSSLITTNAIKVHSSISVDYGVDFTSWGEGVNHCIVCKQGVLGYMPSPNGSSDTSFPGFVPFASGGGSETKRYDFEGNYGLPGIYDKALCLGVGTYEISFSFHFNSGGRRCCLYPAPIETQLTFLRPFNLSNNRIALCSEFTVATMPDENGVFSANNGLPSSFTVRNLLDPIDATRQNFIINPGDYISRVCAMNKDPFTGYAVLTIDLLLQSNVSDQQLFSEEWISALISYGCVYLTLAITKL